MATSITFRIEYRTVWGEEVNVRWSDNGTEDFGHTLTLHTTDGVIWQGALTEEFKPDTVIRYYYVITKEGRETREEWRLFPRYLQVEKERKAYRLHDQWKLVSGQLHFYSSAFTKCLFARCNKSIPLQHFNRQLTVKAHCPRVGNGYALGICGNQPALGDWQAEKAALMNDAQMPEWQINLDAEAIRFPLEYKFVLVNMRTRQVEAWEMRDNHRVEAVEVNGNEAVVLADHYTCFNQPDWKAAGSAIPVFSLRSEKSYGIGDFGDLRLFIDWAVKTHQKVVQILPINDTTMAHTWMDSYPYNSISIFALHPIYMDISQLGVIKNEELRKRYERRQQELNALAQVDYEAVEHVKWEVFRILYEQDGKQTFATSAYKRFFQSNCHWLQPYAVYSYLRDLYQTADFRQWPHYSEYLPKDIDTICQEQAHEIGLFYYLQYHLHLQLTAAGNHARRHGVILKGDIPIGISRCSVEAWAEPYYFNMNGQAGAPPDDFSVNGQNWGFPTYNWDEMEKDNYRWWMRRFQKMAEYFDAYRIDHILGFFRIWQIPVHSVHGLLGQFVPSLPLTREEIETYGLHFNEELYTRPYINGKLLHRLFGDRKQWVIHQFMESLGADERYRLRPEFDTQRKVEAYFSDKLSDPSMVQLRDGLYSLISNVLFIRDQKEPQKYHPRISVQKDPVFGILSSQERDAFNHLYDHYYYHRHNLFWQQQAMKKLPRLTGSTRMLVCGEDLGMIPECVGWVMNDLQILSLEIQRMPKEPYQEFGRPENYPYRSVCTISTHDMSTLRGWWEENASQTQRFYNVVLRHNGQAPEHMTGKLCEEVIRQHLTGNSMLCILSFQDWLSMDETLRNPDVEAERINIPAHPRHYWRYRMHLPLETLLQAKTLNQRIADLIDTNERNPQL